MRTEYQVNAAIGALKRNYENAVSNNRALDGKINELNTALALARQARSSAEAVFNTMHRHEAPGQWQGKTRDRFDRSKTNNLAGEAKNLMRSIDATINEIEREKSRLQSQKNPFVSIISSFDSSLRRLNRELRNIQQAASDGGSR